MENLFVTSMHIPWIDRGGGQSCFLFFHVVRELTMKIDCECLIKLIGSCRNKVQVYRSVRMPQLHTSLHFT